MNLNTEDADYLATIVRSQVMTGPARALLLDVIEWARDFTMSPKLRLVVACERAIRDYHDGGYKITGDKEGCDTLALRIRQKLGRDADGNLPDVTVERAPGGWKVRALETEVTLQ